MAILLYSLIEPLITGAISGRKEVPHPAPADYFSGALTNTALLCLPLYLIITCDAPAWHLYCDGVSVCWPRMRSVGGISLAQSAARTNTPPCMHDAAMQLANAGLIA